MKRDFLYFSLISFVGIMLISLLGCGSPTQYALTQKDVYQSKQTHPLKVAVATFQDTRPLKEELEKQPLVKGTAGSPSVYYPNGKELTDEVTKMFIAHLQFSEIFESVQLAPFTSEESTPTFIKGLADADVDAVITGKIKFVSFIDSPSFYETFISSFLTIVPFQIGRAEKGCLVGCLGGTLGFLISLPIAMLIPDKQAGETQFVDVQLISVKTGKPIWRGEAGLVVRKTHIAPFSASRDALRKAINQLIQQISEADLSNSHAVDKE